MASLDISKSAGPDGISAKMLKGTAVSIVYSLTKLFNQSILQGTLPRAWKIARIVPIPKNTEKSLPKNYRPISILPLINKLLERHIHKLILDHFASSLPISPRQCGFMTGRSTSSALLTVTHDVLHSLDDGNEVCSIFFDLKKAFDSVPHQKLIDKLINAGVCSYLVQWLYDYLFNRMQFVVVNGEQSPVLPVMSGVPQGSVLGPLLFLIYINDVTCRISDLSKITLFADDITLYRTICSILDYLALQEDITSIATWVTENCLSLNADKCCCMLFSKKRLHSAPPVPLHVDGRDLSMVSQTKYLGVLLSSDM